MRTSEDRQAFVARRSAEMQANPTPEEALLWERLKPLGFVRQVAIGGETKNGGRWDYILDFVLIPSVESWQKGRDWLCVEADGAQHQRTKGRDRRRATRLAQLGIHTIRFSNTRIRKDIEGVMREIEETMKSFTLFSSSVRRL